MARLFRSLQVSTGHPPSNFLPLQCLKAPVKQERLAYGLKATRSLC